MELDNFTKAYIEAALWSSRIDNSDEADDTMMDAEYSMEDIAPETLAKMVEDCKRFQLENYDVLEEQYLSDIPNATAIYAGHDFWLTRNGHGAGFWDGDWEEMAGELLTKSAESFGEIELYVGDDGLIYS